MEEAREARVGAFDVGARGDGPGERRIMTAVLRSRIAALLTCAAAIASFVTLRFARSAFQGILGLSGTATLPRPTVFAVALTHPAFLLSSLLICLAAVAAAEAAVKSEATRLLVQASVLLLFLILLAVALTGFLIPFYIPDVRIP